MTCWTAGMLLLPLAGHARAPQTSNRSSDRCENGPLAHAQQLILVISPSWNSKDAKLARFEGSTRGGWTSLESEPSKVVLGRSGLGWGLGLHDSAEAERPGDPRKKEGDGRSPAGAFAIGDAFGYHPAGEVGFGPRGEHVGYHQVDANSKCIDDPASRFYNQDIYDESRVTQDWYLRSNAGPEDLRRSDDLYEYTLNVGHNGQSEALKRRSRGERVPVPGRGSCIFLHTWRAASTSPSGTESRPGTAGCTAMPKEEIHRLVRWIRPRAHPTLVQLTAEDYQRLKSRWCLPPIDVARWTDVATDASAASHSPLAPASSPVH